MGNVKRQGRTSGQCINQMLSSLGNGNGVIDQASVAPKTITGVSTASPGVITSAGHGLPNGTYVLISGVVGATEVNGIGKVANTDTNTFTLQTPAGVDINVANTYTSGGTVNLAYVYKPASTKVAIVTRLNGYAHDGAYASTQYMGIAALTNGVEVKWYRNQEVLATKTATPVKIWPQWYLNAGVDATNADGGIGTRTESPLRWSFFKGCGEIRVDGGQNEFLACIIQDDITALDGQEMAIQGHF